ncbi:MAG TPA: helix-turn-helix domain-containing protein [Calditrichia bacterium]|nr:helix-turn-helix domain-containing protein [Calditrichia bacterium]
MIPINLWSLLFGFSALQGLFFSLILLSQKKGRPAANRLLGILLMLNGHFLLVEVLRNSQQLALLPHLAGTNWPYWFLLGPLFFLYVRTQLRENFSGRQLLHLLPAVWYIWRLWPFYRLPGPEKVEIVQQPWAGGFSWILVMMGLSAVIYLGLTYFSLRKWRRAHANTRQPGNTFLWLERIVFTFWLYLMFDFLAGNFLPLLGWPVEPLVRTSTLLISLFVQLVAFTAVRSPERVFFNINSEEDLTVEENPAAKYHHSALSEGDIQNYVRHIEALMTREKPHLDSELQLSGLAERAGLSPHNLSQVLNQGFGRNFYDFVNHYRLEEVMERLPDPHYRHQTILGIALDCGFNSKTAFNRFFKKHTGETPSSYLKSHRPLLQRASA